MTRVGTLLLIAATVGATVVPEPVAAKGNKLGVFGTINGKKFKATNVEGADDDCVNGIYVPATGNIVFSAIECRRRRRRQGVAAKRNHQLLVMACARYDPNASLVPPYEIPAPSPPTARPRPGDSGCPSPR